MSHTHFIGFKENITCHPEMKVKILHFCNIVLILYLVIERLCYNSRVRSICLYFKQRFSLLRSKHICIADKSFFKVFAFSYKEIDSLMSRKLFAYMTYCTFKTFRESVICSTIRFTVYVISSEYLISTFS